MEGFLDLLIIGFVLYATLRGMMGARRRETDRPGEGTEKPPVRTRAERKEIDWDEAIGDVLEGLGLPRPEEARPDRPAETQETEWEVPIEPEPRSAQPADDRTLLEIAGLAEAAAYRERRPPAHPLAGRDEPDTPTYETVPTTTSHAREAAAPGLKRLDEYSELERAILYAEILGPPKALGE